MSDLISREAAIKMLQEKAQGYVVSMFATMTECNIAKIVAMECANELNGLPAVDAEPVRHGYWLWRDEWTQVIGEPTEHETGWECSVCHTELESYIYEAISESAEIEGYEPKMEYCPKCGAKMDLEDDDE